MGNWYNSFIATFLEKDWKSSITEYQYESTMAKICITYLKTEVTFAQGGRTLVEHLSKNPLYIYSLRFWGDHTRKVQKNLVVVRQIATEFLLSDRRSVANRRPLQKPDKKRMSRIEVASFCDLDEILKVVLIVRPETINAQTLNGWTLLFYAVLGKSYKSVDLLLQYGADPNIRDEYGSTVLHYAIAAKNGEIAGRLLADMLNFSDAIRMEVSLWNELVAFEVGYRN